MKYRFHFLILFIIVVMVSCVEEENQQPVIQSTTASPETIKTGETTQLSCVATDPDGDQLIYSWSSSKGTFPNGTSGGSVTWKAPDESGTNTISIIVSDGQNISEGSVNITIETNPQLSVTPIELDFGSEDNEKTVAIKNTGTGTLNWTISEDLEWLTLSTKSGETTTETDNITVTVDRDDLSAGSYTETITISSENGDQDISIKMEVEESTANYGEFTDSRDGRTYKTVKIGEQTWMAENLAYLPTVSPHSSGSSYSSYRYVYGYEGTNITDAKNSSYYNTYGVLYNLEAAKIDCPSGWHLPDSKEWDSLFNSLGGTSVCGGKMKETGITHWLSPNTGATNSSGFSALPGGNRFSSGFTHMGEQCHFWSDIGSGNSVDQFVPYLGYAFSSVAIYGAQTSIGYSVRCIKD